MTDAPRLARPTPQQRAWQDLELGLFIHFGVNTFTDREWGDGKEDPAVFNPTALDARQWASTAKRAGFKYLILTAKHHDGFCLWPSAVTDHSIESSPWKGGKGDVVREAADACRAEGVKFGLYLSPWDRHEPTYPDKAAYDRFYARQLEELMTGYGPLVEVWFDGAGSEGRTYDWPSIIAQVKKHQPDAMIFNMGEPTIRWSGNEEGVAPYPCWNGHPAPAEPTLFSGDPDGEVWRPAECDGRIRKNWFWHENDADTLKPVEKLMDMYYRSVGHGVTLLLNIGPDTRGLLPERDAERLIEFGDEIKRRFGKPLAETKGSGETVELKLDRPARIDHAVTMEEIRDGERVREYALEAKTGDGWKEVCRGSAVGHKKIDRFEPVEASALRLRVLKSAAEPKIRKLAAYSVGG